MEVSVFTLSGQSPAEGAKHISKESLIEFTIVDDGTGIDLSSLVVEINGIRAIENITFSNGFDGAFSEISVADEDVSVIIDKESDYTLGEVVLVKLQTKNNDGKYFNYNYVFKILPKEPILVSTSPEDAGVILSPQILYLEFEDEVDDVNTSSINIYLNELLIISDGVFQDGYDGSLSEIKKITNGATVRIDPDDPLRNAEYTLKYNIEDTSGNKLSGKINFTVNLPEAILQSVFPQIKFVGFAQGLRKVTNLGRGDALRIEWYKPLARMYKGETFALIYENSSRLEIFDSDPKYIAPSSLSSTPSTTDCATIDGYTPGTTLAFAVRGLESFADTFDLTGMDQIDSVYSLPDAVEVAERVDPTDVEVKVDSTSGYPATGLLLLNSSEVIKYVTKDDDTFYLTSSGSRGLNDTVPGTYLEGDPVKLFLACQDKNSVIATATPTYIDGYESGREIEGVGLVVTDYTDNDKKFFQGFDFCGYHRPIPQHILQGKDDCGSYIGGEFNHLRGFNLFDRMLNREEVLLDQVGEPVILLRRIWSGDTCSCSDSRRMHPKVKSCKRCYGTGYAGGYSQYEYKRRSDGRIMVQFGDTTEDLKLDAKSHLEQVYEPQCWTLPNPAIRDRDLIVRYDFNDDVEFIYEVLDNTKDKLFYRHFTRQKLKLKRLDKTDVVYTFPYSLDT
jgi:methionine-rich copper-binding protein CopC